MFKYLILAVIINAVFVINRLTNQDVFLHINAPSQVEAGSSVNIEVELNKSNITGFARFHQKLPAGITASPVYPAEMSFSFEDNTVKMIWLNLPGEEKINLRYQIHIDERLQGDLHLNGTFSYIDNNRRNRVEAKSTLLAVSPSPDIDERFIADIGESVGFYDPSSPSSDPAGNIFAIRQDPVPDNNQGFIVNILVNKEDKSHFAKIEEIIPEGYTAVEMNSKGGIFSFSDQRARMIWRTLPAENNFLVTYRLIRDNETYDVPDVRGEFSFIHNDITATRRIFQRDTDLKALSENEKNELIASLTRETQSTPTFSGPAYSPSTEKRYISISSSAKETKALIRTGEKISNSLEAESGVYYRVQLAAGHRPVDIRKYFGSLNVNDNVYTEKHEGWFKYSVGSYYNYKSARDYRVHIWKTTPIDDAFVAAYNEGVRITVQEALMITNHQWYR